MYDNEYSKLVDLAYKKLDICLTTGKAKPYGIISNLLIGFTDAYSVKNREGEHNYQAVIDALYKYNVDHPECSIPEHTNEAICRGVIPMSAAFLKGINDAYNIIEYMYDMQEKRKATFELNIKYYLEFLRNYVNKYLTKNPNLFNNEKPFELLDRREQHFIKK